MSTIGIAWSNVTGQGDWARDAAGALAMGDDLAMSIWMSLFTDRRAAQDDRLTDGSEDRRGWWADAYADVPIGSRLWLLDRAVRSDETLRRAEAYAREALAWLVTDGVAARVEVSAQWAPPTSWCCALPCSTATGAVTISASIGPGREPETCRSPGRPSRI
ncbi:phage GP46 family protein [Roseomonas xinghualingensis]|uniref:phage GP46 family protein n=1 Tax=Roseomonas xinghualingensis TaxID=2986475 RepID=UPI0021F20640|nr:phage GP46 family protein [Roseomonas sp. SXEYE001]MCV4207578.1 phage GP46 family protein [Roseomonas sp. SXEYE001]